MYKCKYIQMFLAMLFHTGDLFLKVGYLLPATQFKEGILMPALGSIFASKAGDKAGTDDRPGHMTSPAMSVTRPTYVLWTFIGRGDDATLEYC